MYPAKQIERMQIETGYEHFILKSHRLILSYVWKEGFEQADAYL